MGFRPTLSPTRDSDGFNGGICPVGQPSWCAKMVAAPANMGSADGTANTLGVPEGGDGQVPVEL